MTARRTNTSPKLTPARTGGDDRPAGACYGLAERMAPEPTPFDVLTDHSAGPAFEAARREARSLCGTCPIMVACLRANRDEPWAKAVIGRKPRSIVASGQRVKGLNNATISHYHARLSDLRAFIAAGTGLEEACAQLGISRDGLWKWCNKHGHKDLWANLSPPRPEPVVRRVDRRRKKVAA